MGLGRKVNKLKDEYMRDPHAQFWRHFDKMLNIAKNQNIGMDKLIKHIENYKK